MSEDRYTDEGLAAMPSSVVAHMGADACHGLRGIVTMKPFAD